MALFERSQAAAKTGLSDLSILVLAFLLVFVRGSAFWPLFPETHSLLSLAWIEIGVWFFLSLLIIRALQKNGVWLEFLCLWHRQRVLYVFLAFSLTSILWSISPSDSFYRTMLLLFSTFTGAYLGFQYGSQRLLSILFWCGTSVLVLCYGLLLIAPTISTMTWAPYDGAWRGVFWHKNHLGSIIAVFSAVFLIRAIEGLKSRSVDVFRGGLLYALSLILIYEARSAGGYVVAILLNGLVILSAVWLRISPSLKPAHYYAAIGILVVASVIVSLNLDFAFALLNRNPSLTGRVPLWGYLLHVVQQSPWMGYGFGAIWTVASFRYGLQSLLGWMYPVYISDNGFLDILLHLGVVGLALFLGVWVSAWICSFRHVRRYRTLPDFFPLSFMLFTLVANLSYSLFLETESFVWMMLVAVLFSFARSQTQPCDA